MAIVSSSGNYNQTYSFNESDEHSRSNCTTYKERRSKEKLLRHVGFEDFGFEMKPREWSLRSAARKCLGGFSTFNVRPCSSHTQAAKHSTLNIQGSRYIGCR